MLTTIGTVFLSISIYKGLELLGGRYFSTKNKKKVDDISELPIAE